MTFDAPGGGGGGGSGGGHGGEKSTTGWNTFGGDRPQRSSNGRGLPGEGVSEFLDVRSQRWVVFGRVWNEVVVRLRAIDIISDAEKDNLVFSTFDWLSKPVYLPLFQTAGCVETAMYLLKEAAAQYLEEREPQKKLMVLDEFTNAMDVTTREAVMELWELLAWLFSRLLGNVHQADVTVLVRVLGVWACSDDIFSRINADGINAVAAIAANIVGLLKGTMGKRKKAPVVTSEVLHRSHEAKEAAKVHPGDDSNGSSAVGNGSAGGNSGSSSSSSSGGGGLKRAGMKKSVSTGFLAGLESNEDLPRSAEGGGGGGGGSKADTTTKRFAKLQPFRQAAMLTDNIRDKIREELRSMLQGAPSPTLPRPRPRFCHLTLLFYFVSCSWQGCATCSRPSRG